MLTVARFMAVGLLVVPGAGCVSASEPPVVPETRAGHSPDAADSARPMPGAVAWTIEQTDSGGVLTTARLPGTSRFDGRQADATLEIGCRADEDDATLTIGFRIARTLAFDFDAFEGPEGIGQTHPLLQFNTADSSPSRHLVGGWWLDADTYLFGASLPMADTLLADVWLWPTQPGRSLDFAVLLMERNSDPNRLLSMRFTLPVDGTKLERAIAPCVRISGRQ